MKQAALTLLLTATAFAQSNRDPLVARLGSAERRFAQKIYTSVAKRKSSGNLAIAPYGVFESLSMLQRGARGDTAAAIANVTGVRSDRGTLAAFKRIRQQAAPFAMQFEAAVSDNDGYGVKLIEEPSNQLSSLGIEKGDLIFTVDGRPVRTAREFTDACSGSTGRVRLDGFSHKRGTLFTQLTAPLQRVVELNVEPNNQVINFASALWLHSDFATSSTYPQQLAQLFGTRTFASSFRNLDEMTDQANAFFGRATGGRIARVDMPEQLSTDTMMLLMNAMAMDAKWERRFQTAMTSTGRFTTPTDEIKVRYMQQQNVFACVALDKVKVIELPYRNTDLRMTVFLPTTLNGWDKLESGFFLNSLELHNIARQMRPTRIDLKLPKFDIRMSGSLKSAVQALGLETMFAKEANFTGIDGGDRVMLDDMRQQVFVATNEEGTRAGAVTQAVGILKSSAMKSEPFHATHPFLFLIRDSNGIIYFAGRVTQPTLAAE